MRKFTNYKYWYPYQTLLPPELKNEVSRKREPRGSTSNSYTQQQNW